MSVTPVPFPDASLPLPDPENLGTWAARMAEMHRWMRETARPGINNQGAVAFQNAAFAQQMAELAMATASFAGNWSDLIGALNVPASVFHTDQFWVLTSNLPDVTAAEPGVSAAWVEFVDDFAKKTGETFTGPVNVPMLNGGQLAGNRNKILNGSFLVNQRNVSGTVTLAPGAYGLDQLKAGPAGCTFTFSTTAGVRTLNITAGTLVQVIRGTRIQAGPYVLSFQGTASGRINGGLYGASGAVTATLTGGSNTTIEFSTGTLALAQLEPGVVVTPFEHRLNELPLCQAEFERINLADGFDGNAGASAITIRKTSSFKATKNVFPSVSVVGLATSNTANLGIGVVWIDSFEWFYEITNANIVIARRIAAIFDVSCEL